MYQRENENIKGSVDRFSVIIYLILIVCGWLSIYGSSYEYGSESSLFDFSGRAGMQMVWMGTSLIIAFVLLKLDSNVFDIFAYYIYFAAIALLLLTVIIAPNTKGSHSWLVITDTIRIQPAEFAKFAVALALAKFISSYNFKLMTAKSLSLIFLFIALPMGIIFMQNETGSALVYAAFVLMLYREGLPGIVLMLGALIVLFFVVGLKYSGTDIGIMTTGEYISTFFIIVSSAMLVRVYEKDKKCTRIILLLAVLLFAAFFAFPRLSIPIDLGILAFIGLFLLFVYLVVLARVKMSRIYFFVAIFILSSAAFVASINYVFSDVMQPYQQSRIKEALGMENDLMGFGYNVNQSKIAIGSGGFLGKGFLNGTQTKLKYVPEQDTDFIFCTVGEEQGFVGSVLVLLLFLALLLRLIYLSERQQNTFGRVYGYCVFCVFLFHLFINIGMVTGITPVIGIPLPFFSYGGSSLWSFTILLFIFLRIDMARKRR